MELVWPASGQGRKGTSQNVIHSAVSAGLLDGQDIVRLFDHANRFLVARRADAIKARARVGDIVTDRAFANFFFGVTDAVGQRQRIFRRGPQQEKRQALRGLLAYARKMFQLLEQSS